MNVRVGLTFNPGIEFLIIISDSDLAAYVSDIPMDICIIVQVNRENWTSIQFQRPFLVPQPRNDMKININCSSFFQTFWK